MTDYNLTNIRTLLTAAFTDEEFDQFCYDQFRPVYESFSGGMSRTKKIHGLIEYCDRKLLMDKLLGLIQQTQPARQIRHHAAAVEQKYQPLALVGLKVLDGQFSSSSRGAPVEVFVVIVGRVIAETLEFVVLSNPPRAPDTHQA